MNLFTHLILWSFCLISPGVSDLDPLARTSPCGNRAILEDGHGSTSSFMTFDNPIFDLPVIAVLEESSEDDDDVPPHARARSIDFEPIALAAKGPLSLASGQRIGVCRAPIRSLPLRC